MDVGKNAPLLKVGSLFIATTPCGSPSSESKLGVHTARRSWGERSELDDEGLPSPLSFSAPAKIHDCSVKSHEFLTVAVTPPKPGSVQAYNFNMGLGPLSPIRSPRMNGDGPVLRSGAYSPCKIDGPEVHDVFLGGESARQEAAVSPSHLASPQMSCTPQAGACHSVSPIRPCNPQAGARRSASPQLPCTPQAGARRSASPLPCTTQAGARRSVSPQLSCTPQEGARRSVSPQLPGTPGGGARCSLSPSSLPGTGVFLGGRLSQAEVVAFGGVPIGGIRSSERIRAQPNADSTQLDSSAITHWIQVQVYVLNFLLHLYLMM
jgi:hypothetical protein